MPPKKRYRDRRGTRRGTTTWAGNGFNSPAGDDSPAVAAAVHTELPEEDNPADLHSNHRHTPGLAAARRTGLAAEGHRSSRTWSFAGAKGAHSVSQE